MDKQPKLKAALYIRVSTEEQAQDGQSASAQEETLKQYCRAFGIEVAEIYRDLGLSGKSLRDRIGLKKLMEDCGNNSFNMVLVWKISRLSRNLKDLLYLIDFFERHSVHFASCSEKFDTSTPVGRMTLQLLGSIAEFERNTIVENVKLGLKEFARKGGKAASLLGYDNIDKKLVINEGEAAVVKMIFDLYTNSGMNYSAIAEHLNRLGYKTKRGSSFRSSGISYIIHNPAYIGVNRHGRNTDGEYCISGSHPAIINEDVWNKAQSVKNNKSYNRGSYRDAGSLRVPVNCLQCKTAMKVFYSVAKGKKYKYLRCCSCSSYVNYGKLEKAAAEALLKAIDDSSNWQAMYNALNSTAMKEQSLEAGFIESELKRLEKSRERYMELFESYKLSDTSAFIDRLEAIERRIKALTRKKLELSGDGAEDCRVDYASYFESLKASLAALDTSVISRLSACLIKSIGIYKGEIKIVLHL
jgi:site-specific DNA recombinase